MPDFKQIAQLVNLTTAEVIGESEVLTEDLSNVVDFGGTIENSGKSNQWLTSFVDRIGKVIAYDRAYKMGYDLGILKDNLEYGTMLQRMTIDELPEAVENQTWEILDGASVDPYVVHLPKASAKYYDKRTAWEIDMTILDKQYRSAFNSPSALASFVAMVWTAIENSKSLKVESLQMALLRAKMAETIKSDFASGNYDQSSGVKAINLLYLYNQEFPTALLTKAEALTNKDFLRFASMKISEMTRAIKQMSVLYNVEGAARFTPADKMKIAILGKFSDAAQYYLDADTFHDTLVSLPSSVILDNWQGTGTTRDLESLSKIDIKTDKGTTTLDGVLATIYDVDGLGITAENYRVTSQYNAAGEYTNYFNKAEFAGCIFSDMNNIVFFIQ